MNKSITVVIFAAVAITTFAEDQPAAATSPATSSGSFTQSVDYCPAVEKLKKEGLYWQAEGGWVSYSESFDTQLSTFAGAQWQGVNVGKIICLYMGNSKMGFPVALEQKVPQLVPVPAGANWSKDLGGYRQCNSQKVTDCEFVVYKKRTPANIYEELEFFKGKKGIEENDQLLPPRY